MSQRAAPTDPGRSGGLRRILLATVLAGAAGYLIQAIAGWGLTPSEYAGFGVFWATFYLLVGAVSGVQQEVARVATPSHDDVETPRRHVLLQFAVIVATLVLVLVGMGGILVAPLVFGPGWVSPLSALVVGAVAYVFFSTLSGALYGHEDWGGLSVVIVSDPLLRVMTVSGALLLGVAWVMPWAIVIPILLTAVLAVILLARRRNGGTQVAEGIPRLLGNVAQTVVGSAATAILISALPLFIAMSASAEDAETTGALIFNLTITRAPLVIPILALQGWLIIRFRGGGAEVAGRAFRIVASIIGVGVVLGGVAWVVVPWIVGPVFGQDYVVAGWLSAGIVLTASLTGALCASGALAVAQSGHHAYVIGWVIAATITVGLLFVPLGFETRVLVALAAGPLAGLCVHLGYFALVRGRSVKAGASVASAGDGVAH